MRSLFSLYKRKLFAGTSTDAYAVVYHCKSSTDLVRVRAAMVNVGFAWFALVLVLLQLALLLWFIDTLGSIKIYLREIRDILRQPDRNP